MVTPMLYKYTEILELIYCCCYLIINLRFCSYCLPHICWRMDLACWKLYKFIAFLLPLISSTWMDCFKVTLWHSWSTGYNYYVIYIKIIFANFRILSRFIILLCSYEKGMVSLMWWKKAQLVSFRSLTSFEKSFSFENTHFPHKVINILGNKFFLGLLIVWCFIYLKHCFLSILDRSLFLQS